MSDNREILENEATGEEGQIIEVPEVIRVKSGNSFVTGLIFGLGFWLAFILYGLIFVFVAPTVLRSERKADTREVTYYRPPTQQRQSDADKLEEFKATLERIAPSETLEEAMERVDREARLYLPAWNKYSDPNER